VNPSPQPTQPTRRQPRLRRARQVLLSAIALAAGDALSADAKPPGTAPAVPLYMSVHAAPAAASPPASPPTSAPAAAKPPAAASAPAAPTLLAAASVPPAKSAPAAMRQPVRSAPPRVSIGAPPAWVEKRFVYRADNKRLGDVLQDFAASQSLPAVVAEDLEGVVNGNFDVKIDVFLDSMARTYNFLWYHDGSALYFYPGRAIQSRMFRLKGFRRQQVQNLLQSLEIGDKRYPIRYDEAQSTLYVSGPPRHVELVTSAIETLDAGLAEAALRSVQVFPLRFATAGDRTVGGVTVVGVASTLRKLYAGAGAAANSAQDVLAMIPDSTAELAEMTERTRRGIGPLPKLGQKPAGPKPDLRGNAHTGQGGKGKRGEQDDAPQIEADEGTNSVVIQGRSDRMADYGALIQRLDQKPMLVELVATIIEVSSDSVDQLGINWSMKSAGGNSVSVSGPQGRVDGLGGLFTLGTVVANAGRELLARVDALQGEGKARIVSRPSVLGVANRTAVMREQRIATVRVAGEREANLFRVEAGTLLEMTPQVTYADGNNRIKLSIYIEDGNFEATQVDQIPIVKKTEIRTEAHVREGESLLIAGITIESDKTQRNGVPGLQSVPMVGGLFRNTDSRTQRIERMFLITPRLPSSSATAAAAAQARTEAAAAAAAPQPVPAAKPARVAAPARFSGVPAGEFADGGPTAP
jgi:type III secretion protein C